MPRGACGSTCAPGARTSPSSLGSTTACKRVVSVGITQQRLKARWFFDSRRSPPCAAALRFSASWILGDRRAFGAAQPEPAKSPARGRPRGLSSSSTLNPHPGPGRANRAIRRGAARRGAARRGRSTRMRRAAPQSAARHQPGSATRSCDPTTRGHGGRAILPARPLASCRPYPDPSLCAPLCGPTRAVASRARTPPRAHAARWPPTLTLEGKRAQRARLRTPVTLVRSEWP